MTGMGTGDSVVAVAGNSSCASLDGKAGQTENRYCMSIDERSPNWCVQTLVQVF